MGTRLSSKVKRLGGGQLDRYLLRRLAVPVSVSLGMILAALLLDKALRLVQALSDSGARLEFLLPLMAALAPYFLVTAAPFAFFTGLLITVSAMDEAGEIEAILAAGVSPGRLAAPFVAAGAAMALAILLVSAGPEPLGRFSYSKGLAQAQQAGWSGRLEPGVVFTPKPGASLEAEQVLLVGHRLRGVFQTERNILGGETVTTAREGSWSFVHGGRDVALTLRDGSVLRDDARSGATFGRFDVLDEIESSGLATSRPIRGGDERELTLPELFGGLGAGGHRGHVVAAELAVKLVQAAVLVFLPLFALPLALASKRGGRAPGMIVAVASLAAFHHAVEFFKGLVVNGRLASAWPIVACLGVFAALCIAVHLSSRRRPGDNPITRTGAWLAWVTRGVRRRVALLGGVSWLTRGFSGLPAYVGWLFAVRTGFAGLGFVAFFQIVDLQEMSPKILGRGLGVAGLFHYESLRLPAMMLQLGGLAVLVGAVATFFALGQRSESVAMQACGVSPYRILLATVPVALVVAAIDLGLSSEVAPHAQAALDGWWSASTPVEERVAPRGRWLRVGRDLLHVDHISADGRSLQGVKMYHRDPTGLLQARTSTAALQWSRAWRAGVTRFDQLGAMGDVVTLAPRGVWTDVGLKPFDLRAVTRTSDETTTIAAVWTRVSGAATDKRGHDLATRVQHGLSEPLSPFIMLLLASPVLVWSGGRRGQALPMGAALASGLGFLMTDGFLTALGEAGDLPALFAAWTAPAIFAAGGAWALSFSDGLATARPPTPQRRKPALRSASPSPLRPLAICAGVLLTCTGLATFTPAKVLAEDAPCDGRPSGVRLFISVDRVAHAEGQVAATIYPDDPHRFLAHHGQLAVVRRPSAAPSTGLCVWLPTPGRYEVAVYQDLNDDRRFNRTALGLPAEPYGLSNDPPNLMGLPTFRSVQFPVHAGDNTIHIPLHNSRR